MMKMMMIEKDIKRPKEAQRNRDRQREMEIQRENECFSLGFGDRGWSMSPECGKPLESWIRNKTFL